MAASNQLLPVVLLALVLAASGKTTATSPCVVNDCRHLHVRYPFWVDGDGNGTQCGYPPLRLECRGGDTPVLRLPSGDYGVTAIHYNNRTLTVYDILASINSSCPMVAGRNLSLPTGSPPPLSLTTRNTNITFLLDCDFPGFVDLVPCLTNGHNHSYVFGNGTHRLPYDRVELCQQAVGMPVLHPVQDVVPAIKAGFEISWSSPAVGGECEACEKAGGFCGQRQRIFNCFNSSSPPTTSSSGPKTTTIIVLVVIMFVVVFIFMLALIFWPTNPQDAQDVVGSEPNPQAAQEAAGSEPNPQAAQDAARQ